MSTHRTLTTTSTLTARAAWGRFPMSRIAMVVAAVAGTASVLLLAGLLSAMPQAGAADARVAMPAITLPSAHGDTSVPDAAVALAGRQTVIDEPAPTF